VEDGEVVASAIATDESGGLRVAGAAVRRTGFLRLQHEARGAGAYCVSVEQGLVAWSRPQPNTGSLPGVPRSRTVAAKVLMTRVESGGVPTASRAAAAAVTKGAANEVPL
jgi:hypothetical protein